MTGSIVLQLAASKESRDYKCTEAYNYLHRNKIGKGTVIFLKAAVEPSQAKHGARLMLSHGDSWLLIYCPSGNPALCRPLVCELLFRSLEFLILPAPCCCFFATGHRIGGGSD